MPRVAPSVSEVLKTSWRSWWSLWDWMLTVGSLGPALGSHLSHLLHRGFPSSFSFLPGPYLVSQCSLTHTHTQHTCTRTHSLKAVPAPPCSQDASFPYLAEPVGKGAPRTSGVPYFASVLALMMRKCTSPCFQKVVNPSARSSFSTSGVSLSSFTEYCLNHSQHLFCEFFKVRLKSNLTFFTLLDHVPLHEITVFFMKYFF